MRAVSRRDRIVSTGCGLCRRCSDFTKAPRLLGSSRGAGGKLARHRDHFGTSITVGTGSIIHALSGGFPFRFAGIWTDSAGGTIFFLSWVLFFFALKSFLDLGDFRLLGGVKVLLVA